MSQPSNTLELNDQLISKLWRGLKTILITSIGCFGDGDIEKQAGYGLSRIGLRHRGYRKEIFPHLMALAWKGPLFLTTPFFITFYEAIPGIIALSLMKTLHLIRNLQSWRLA